MTQDQLEEVVIQIQDRLAISDCLTRYSRGVDRLDRELLLSAYHEDAIDDHGGFVGTREEFADYALGLHAKIHLSHQHCLFNHTCELDGDVAHTETYFMFVGVNREGETLMTAGGRYLDRFEKRNGRWAIAQRVCVRDWAPLAERPDMADPSTFIATRALLPREMLEFVQGGPRVARDRTDPSYDRPLTIDPERIRRGRELQTAGDD
jgi:SnoaL-like domain